MPPEAEAAPLSQPNPSAPTESSPASGRLADNHGRTVTYLRLSVTERCNLRCQYCLPENIQWDKDSDILSFEEIARLVRIMAGLGVRKIRLTGGEPLVRRQLPTLVRMIAEIPNIDEVMMTTNAMTLDRFAVPLKEAGLNRLNISLDTLNSKIFRHITRGGSLAAALEGIEAARKAGFKKTKLNIVAMRDYNLMDSVEIVRFAHEREMIPCFIELMPMGEKDFTGDQYVPTSQLKEMLGQRLTLLPDENRVGSGPARYLRVKETGSLVGFITPLSENFCADCNRMRLSSDGKVRNCLAYEQAGDFKSLLRDPEMSDERIAQHAIKHLLGKGSDHQNFVDTDPIAANVMMSIGG